MSTPRSEKALFNRDIASVDAAIAEAMRNLLDEVDFTNPSEETIRSAANALAELVYSFRLGEVTRRAWESGADATERMATGT